MAFIPVVMTKDGRERFATSPVAQVQLEFEGWTAKRETASVRVAEHVSGEDAAKAVAEKKQAQKTPE